MSFSPFNGLHIVNVGFETLHPDAKAPVYGSKEAAGADLVAVTYPEDYPSPVSSKGDLALKIGPGERRLIRTGIAIELPEGFEAQIRPRSGLALKHGITVLNTPGTIDSDYRGEIGVVLLNTSDKTFYVNPGDRIAQMVIVPVWRANFRPSRRPLGETERGASGFGSTGVA